MAIKFQYNKTSLQELNKQLKVRQNTLPTIKNKADGNYVGIYNESGFKKIKTVSLRKGQKYYIKVARSYNSNATYKLKVKKVK